MALDPRRIDQRVTESRDALRRDVDAFVSLVGPGGDRVRNPLGPVPPMALPTGLAVLAGLCAVLVWRRSARGRR